MDARVEPAHDGSEEVAPNNQPSPAGWWGRAEQRAVTRGLDPRVHLSAWRALVARRHGGLD